MKLQLCKGINIVLMTCQVFWFSVRRLIPEIDFVSANALLGILLVFDQFCILNVFRTIDRKITQKSTLI